MEPATGASGKVYPLPGGAAPSCRAAMTTPSGVQTFGWSVGKIY